MSRWAAVMLSTCVMLVASAAQQPAGELPPEVRRMVADGMVAALEQRLSNDLADQRDALLARAYASRARRATTGEARAAAYDRSAGHYDRWLDRICAPDVADEIAGRIHCAGVRVEYGNMLLMGPVARLLADYEISLGRHGDPDRLKRLLRRAAEQYEAARTSATELLAAGDEREEEYLAAGLFDALVQTRLQATLNLGWVTYYLATLSDEPATRTSLLTQAETRFTALLANAPAEEVHPQCALALGMIDRERGRTSDAERHFVTVFQRKVEPTVAAQARCELARGQIASERFDEARTTLQPLVAKDPMALRDEDQPLRYYVSFAHVLHAYSYLLEARVIERAARTSALRDAILNQARERRQNGLRRLRRLSALGEAWPALVQIYIGAGLNLDTPPAELSPLELLCTATTLTQRGRADAALKRLEAARERPDVDAEVAGDVLFELGRCHYQLDNERAAAETFAALARQHRSHTRAPQAAELALTLWGRVAERSQRPADYNALANVLHNLIQAFADHPRRADALWLLPQALQAAAQYTEAANAYGRVPPESPHAAEARFRQVVCRQHALAAARTRLSDQEFALQARRVSRDLLTYARTADRLHADAATDAVDEWTTTARVAAAELLATRDVADYQAALDAVDELDLDKMEPAQRGRVLAVRIRAHRGLRQFGAASRIVKQFLESSSARQTGATLAALAGGMQEEVARLLDTGDVAAARSLARDAVATFEELEHWMRSKDDADAGLLVVQAGRARMHLLAGEHEAAEEVALKLLADQPRNGNYRRLLARARTAGLGDQSTAAELGLAADAWAAILSDSQLRQRAPDRYWEARYNWLRIALRRGRAADVEQAISQERVWYPDLGGPAWKPRLEALLEEARSALGRPVQIDESK